MYRVLHTVYDEHETRREHVHVCMCMQKEERVRELRKQLADRQEVRARRVVGASAPTGSGCRGESGGKEGSGDMGIEGRRSAGYYDALSTKRVQLIYN